MKHTLEIKLIQIGEVTIKLYTTKEERVQAAYQREKEENPLAPFPYWARLWPSALALSTFLQQQPHYVAGKDVLELAAGLGLPSLLAAHYAHSVCCSDYLPEPLEVMGLSIRANRVTNVTTRLLDWHHLPEGLSADVLLLSDINYDPSEFDILYKVLLGFLQNNTTILLSTPQRLMAKDFIERLLPFCTLQEEMPVEIGGDTTLVSVLVLRKTG